MISLSATRVYPETYDLVKSALDKCAIGQEGGCVERFEAMIAEYVGSKFCIAVSSGTMADAVAVAAMRELHDIRQVIVPALTFIAQPNSVQYNRLGVRFADVTDDGLIDPAKITECKYEEMDFPTLIFATDLMGSIADVDELKRRGHLVIEDACEAFGSRTSDGRFAGTLGEIGTFSFYPSHTITTGEGGAIVTNNSQLAQLCRALRDHGRRPFQDLVSEKFHFDYFGFNAKMSNITAALGVASMLHIGEQTAHRHAVYARLVAALGPDRAFDGYCVPHGYILQYAAGDTRDRALASLLAHGVECRKLFSCIPVEEAPYAFASRAGARFPAASKKALTSLYVPCHQNLSFEDVDYIIRAVQDTAGRLPV